MATIVYNPKFLTVNGRKTLNTADIKNFIWSHARWFLKAGEMKKFPDDVGAAMLRQIEFLVEVKKDNYQKIKEEIEEKKFTCDKCEFKTDTKIAFLGHYRTHEKTDELTDTSGIAEAQPIGEYRGTVEKKDPERDIPQGGTKFNPIDDKDGVGWYGGGMERDSES